MLYERIDLRSRHFERPNRRADLRNRRGPSSLSKRTMMEKLPSGAIDVSKPPQPYTPHLKKVLKTYQKSAIKSLQGPSTVLSDSTSPSSSSSSLASVKKEPESSPELALETPPPVAAPMPQVPILSAADQSAELSNTYVEGHRVACFIIGGEKRICFPQLLSSVLRNVPAYTINNVSTELHINFSSCNSEQLIALKQEGLLPAETPTCGLVTKPDAERLCSVLLHEGGAAPDDLDKHGDYSFLVYHECFSGAKGVLYYQFYTERNWCVQCVICRRLFTPQMFVAHSCCMDKKRNSVHTYIEPGICHWGFDSANWRLYIHVVEEQPDFEKFTKIMEAFKSQHRRSELMPLKRKQVSPQLRSIYWMPFGTFDLDSRVQGRKRMNRQKIGFFRIGFWSVKMRQIFLEHQKTDKVLCFSPLKDLEMYDF